MRRVFWMICLFLFLYIPCSVSAEEPVETAFAADVSKDCRYEMKHAEKLTDEWLQSRHVCEPGGEIKIGWGEDVPVRSAYLQFSFEAAPFSVSLYDAEGGLVTAYEGTQFLNNLLPVPAEARRLVIRAEEEEMLVSTLKMYTEGDVPGFHPWDTSVSKTDLMIIATHPDDEVLFLGAVIPLYEGNGNRNSVEVFTCSTKRTRHEEALNAAWCLGSRQEPVFLDYEDIAAQKKNIKAQPLDALTVSLVRQIRKYRPEVVVSQDVNGEYGHWRHKRTVEAVKLAVENAQDSAFDPASAEEYGAWQVKKLYLHLFPEDRITLDVLSPLEKMGGRTAFEVAQEAFQCHVSQLGGRHSVTNAGVYALSEFGLAYSAVGADTPGVNDMFEHIPGETDRAS